MMSNDKGLVCYYCEKPVSNPWEFQRDHFPIPKRAGGKDTVIACVECHHRKDRTREVLTQEEIYAALNTDSLSYLQREIISQIEDGWDGTMEPAIRTLKRVWGALPTDLRLVNAAIISKSF